jgi:hypothetical protein
MKARRFSVTAVAALALSGAFAAVAHAGYLTEAEKQEKQVSMYCVETEADAAFMAAHPPDRESQRAAWEEIKADVCATVWASYDELTSDAVNSCVLSEQELHKDEVGAGRGIVERCLGTDAVETANRHMAKKRHAKKHAKTHRGKRSHRG